MGDPEKGILAFVAICLSFSSEAVPFPSGVPASGCAAGSLGDLVFPCPESLAFFCCLLRELSACSHFLEEPFPKREQPIGNCSC